MSPLATPRSGLVKVAVIRDPKAAPFAPGARFWLNCQCGAKPETCAPTMKGMDVHCRCGQTYSSSGWKK